MELTKPELMCQQVGLILERIHSGCCPNSVPCACRIEVPISLLAVSQELFSALRDPMFLFHLQVSGGISSPSDILNLISSSATSLRKCSPFRVFMWLDEGHTDNLPFDELKADLLRKAVPWSLVSCVRMDFGSGTFPCQGKSPCVGISFFVSGAMSSPLFCLKYVHLMAPG